MIELFSENTPNGIGQSKIVFSVFRPNSKFSLSSFIISCGSIHKGLVSQTINK